MVDEIFDAIKQVIASASPQSVFSLLENIILTGGGSRIRNLDLELQQRLQEEGMKILVCGLSAKDTSPLVAIGGLESCQGSKTISGFDPDSTKLL